MIAALSVLAILAGVFLIFAVLFAVLYFNEKGKNAAGAADKVKVIDGVRYSLDDAVTREGEANVTLQKGDALLKKGVTYTARKGESFSPGTYTGPRRLRCGNVFQDPGGGAVRSYNHGDNIGPRRRRGGVRGLLQRHSSLNKEETMSKKFSCAFWWRFPFSSRRSFSSCPCSRSTLHRISASWAGVIFAGVSGIALLLNAVGTKNSVTIQKAEHRTERRCFSRWRSSADLCPLPFPSNWILPSSSSSSA